MSHAPAVSAQPDGAAKRAVTGRPAAKVLVAAGIVLLVVLPRLPMFPFESRDYTAFVEWWYAFIDANGGFPALRYQFANYNIPYLYLLALLTYLPVPALAGVKAISVLFDLLLVFFAYRIVAIRHPGGWQPPAAAATVAVLPTVMVNSALWGQCDSIYAAFGLGGVYFALRGRGWLSCVFFGLALAFKLQIVFLLPLVLTLVLLRKIPWSALLAIPVTFLLLDGPALLLGATPGQLLSVYTDQVGEYTQLTLNAPNAYQLLNITDGADTARTAGVLFTGLLVLAIIGFVLASRVPMTVSRALLLATAFAIAVPFFLPAMHERYFYLADVLSVVVAFHLPRRLWYVPLLVQFGSFASYVPFLFGSGQTANLWLPATMMLAALVAVLVALVHSFGTERIRASRPSASSRSAGLSV